MKLKELQSIVRGNKKAQQLNIAVLSNITFEPYMKWLINKVFSDSSLSVNLISVDYNEFLAGSVFNEIEKTNIVVVIPNFLESYADIVSKPILTEIESNVILETEFSNIKRIYKHIRNNSQMPIIWFGYEDYCLQSDIALGTVPTLCSVVDRINILIYDYKQPEMMFVDTKRLIANIGIANAYDNKNKYRWNSPYSHMMIEQICSEIYKQYQIMNGITKKCIVLDCDNVLWGGILSEDGIENIHLGGSALGKPYQDFQRYLLFLSNHGVILTICSKNDLADVQKVFREHSDMILKENRIACFRVNWENKVDSIRKIAEALNIGHDSMVFIDDSDFEVRAVNKLLPEVTTILYNRDTVYEQLSCFNLKSDVDLNMIEQRNLTYQTNELRTQLKENSHSFEEYIASLGMRVEIHSALPVEFTRISELTQRTNKCTNGTRYTVEQIKQLLTDLDYQLYSVSVTDKFSGLGLVGVIAVKGEALVLFSLSCRVLGRKVEDEMLNFIADKHHINQIIFHATGKNAEIQQQLSDAFPNAKICESIPI